MEALDLFAATAAPPAVRGWALSDAELTSAQFVCCQNSTAVSDVERAMMRLGRSPRRHCPDCARAMAIATTPPRVERCVGCDQVLKSTLIHVVGVNSATGQWGWYHTECRLKIARQKISSMATFLTSRHLPDCATCGREYEQHDRPLTTLWDAECDTDDGSLQHWRPAQPFRSRDYPYRLITDSPRYTPDGRIAFGDEGIAA